MLLIANVVIQDLMRRSLLGAFPSDPKAHR
jgi:hypothetical protein